MSWLLQDGGNLDVGVTGQVEPCVHKSVRENLRVAHGAGCLGHGRKSSRTESRGRISGGTEAMSEEVVWDSRVCWREGGRV